MKHAIGAPVVPYLTLSDRLVTPLCLAWVYHLYRLLNDHVIAEQYVVDGGCTCQRHVTP